MKKIVVMSDNHGQEECLYRIKELESDADYYIHCGDSESNSDVLNSFYAVRGNNDWYHPFLKEDIVVTIDGIKFYVCHGHRVGYLHQLENLAAIGRKHHCEVVLFGHTHIPCNKVVSGIRIINPGSTSLPRGGSKKSYACIYINEGALEVVFKRFVL